MVIVEDLVTAKRIVGRSTLTSGLITRARRGRIPAAREKARRVKGRMEERARGMVKPILFLLMDKRLVPVNLPRRL